jgi:hypothetical protein
VTGRRTLARLAAPVTLALLLSAGCSRAVEAPQVGSAPAPAAASAPASASVPGRVISDVAAWQHPTKAVFAKYKVTLKSVTVQDKFATFRVEFPFDPQTEPNAARMQSLCLVLLKANGSWSHALVSEQDHLEIDVSWDKRAGRISIDNHPV